MLVFLRTLLFIVAGWYLIKWLAGWITGGSAGPGKDRGPKREDKYESLTDQKIDDADYEDL
jgi:hypothetical protein